MNADLYYLDDLGTNVTSDWKYYRVSPKHQIHIEVCEVAFPSLKDKGVPIQHAWIVGLAAAHEIKGKHLETLGIDQERARLIGMVVTE